MKKLLALVMLVVLGVPMVGCGSKPETPPAPPPASPGEGGGNTPSQPETGAEPAQEEKKE